MTILCYLVIAYFIFTVWGALTVIKRGAFRTGNLIDLLFTGINAAIAATALFS